MRLPSGLTSRLIQVPERTSSGMSRRSPGGEETSQSAFFSSVAVAAFSSVAVAEKLSMSMESNKDRRMQNSLRSNEPEVAKVRDLRVHPQFRRGRYWRRQRRGATTYRPDDQVTSTTAPRITRTPRICIPVSASPSTAQPSTVAIAGLT